MRFCFCVRKPTLQAKMLGANRHCILSKQIPMLAIIWVSVVSEFIVYSAVFSLDLTSHLKWYGGVFWKQLQLCSAFLAQHGHPQWGRGLAPLYFLGEKQQYHIQWNLHDCVHNIYHLGHVWQPAFTLRCIKAWYIFVAFVAFVAQNVPSQLKLSAFRVERLADMIFYTTHLRNKGGEWSR